MTCEVTFKRDVRDHILDILKTLEDRVTPDGASSKVIEALLKEQLHQIQFPEAVVAALQEHANNQTKPFHVMLKRQLGEELTLLANGVSQSHYLLSSDITRDPNSDNGLRITLITAPADNVAAKTQTTFALGSEVAISSTLGVETTLEGFDIAVSKAAKEWMNHYVSQGKESTYKPSEVEGVNETLERMVQVDEYLGTSGTQHSEDSLIGYHKVKGYEHGNVESMKEMLNKLHVLGNGKASADLLDYYNKLFDSFHPHFFNKMKLYLRKNADETWGGVSMAKEHIKLDIATSKKDIPGKSEAETYAHEVVHTITAWGLRQKHRAVTPIRLKLNHAMEVLRSKTTWEDYLNVDKAVATEADIERAKKLQTYIFSGKNSLDEFIAHVLTNPMAMKAAQVVHIKERKESPSVFHTVTEWFSRLMDVVLGRYSFKDGDMTVFEQVNELAQQLGEINAVTANDLGRLNFLGRTAEAINTLDGKLSQQFSKIAHKVATKDKTIKIPTDSAGPVAWAKFLLALTLKASTSKVHRGFLGLWASALGMKPDGIIREITSSFTERSDEFRISEKLNLVSSRIDAVRNGNIDANAQLIKKSFKNPLSEDEEVALTKVFVRANVSALRYKRGNQKKWQDKDLVDLLTDKKRAKNEMYKTEEKLKDILNKETDKGRVNWYISQARSLGVYMATGKAHVGMAGFSPEAIVRGFGTIERFERNATLEALIEDLATFTAVHYTPLEYKKAVAPLIAAERKGVQVITDMYDNFKLLSKERSFKNNTSHMVLGYGKEIFDSTIGIQIATVAQEAEMSAKGYTLRFKVTPKNGDTYSEPMAVYTTDTWGKNERQKGAVALGKLHAKGMLMSELKRIEDPVAAINQARFGRDFAKVQLEANRIHDSMRKGTFDVDSVSFGMAPLLSNTGTVTDYRYVMPNEAKEDLLNQDLRISEVLSRSIADIEYHERTDAMNAQVLDFIKKNMKANWDSGEVGKDGYTTYTLIGPNVQKEKYKELYAMLPETFKEYIQARPDKTMAIPTEALNLIFGYQHIKLTDIPGISMLPKVIKRIIDVMEGLWMELIKLSKTAILMKMPAVLIGNLHSNIMYMWTTGSLDITSLYKDYVDGFREVNEYIRNMKQLRELEAEVGADTSALRRVKNGKVLYDKVGEKKLEIKRLKSALENNPAHELFESGLYQSYIEDTGSVTTRENNRIVLGINKKLDMLPNVVQTAANIVYLTQNTAWHKVSQEVMQRTDMVSRLAEVKRQKRYTDEMVDGKRMLPLWWLEEKREQNKDYKDTQKLEGTERTEFLERSVEVSRRETIDNYVNYAIPNSSTEEWLNRLGVLMFTKYLKRIQKIVFKTAFNHPLKTLMTFAVSGVLVGDDKIQNSSLLIKGFGYGGGFDVTNLVPIYSPLYHIDNVLTPPILKSELRLGLF